MNQKMMVLKGAAFLTIAGLIGKIAGFFYRIFLSRTIGAEGVGIFQLIFPIYALSFSLSVSGIQSCVSRFVSSRTAVGDKGGARRILHIGLFLSISMSLLVSLFLFRFHNELAIYYVKEARTASLLMLLAYVVPFGSIHACINGYFFGLKQAKIPAISEILEHAVRLGSLFLFYQILTSRSAPITPAIAVYSMIAEEFLAALFSATALTLHFVRQPALPPSAASAWHYTRELIVLSTPLTLNRVLLNILQSIEALLIPLQLQKWGLSSSGALSTYGILTGMALPLIMFPTALTSPVGTMLLPVISEEQAKGQINRVKNVIRKICIWSLLLGGICWFFFFFTGNFLGNMLFDNQLAGSFIRAMSWICPLFYLTPSLFAILNGLGKTSRVFFHNLTGTGLRILFILFAIPKLGISGYLYGILLNQAVVFLLSMMTIKREFQK
ncbi:MAG: polysaccharide biosynthesis protein [Eubacteriales bacterium]|nr:polysaccharide biosynthesis protein [Eubacteriales bacterium]